MVRPPAGKNDLFLELPSSRWRETLAAVLQEVRREQRPESCAIWLVAQRGSRGVWAQFRTSSAALAPLAGRLRALLGGGEGAVLVEPARLAREEADRLYDGLARCEVRVDGWMPEAERALTDQLGPEPEPETYQLVYLSPDEVATVCARCFAEGACFVPTRSPPPPGTSVRLVFLAPDVEPLAATGVALEAAAQGGVGGFRAEMSPGPELERFLVQRSARLRGGRRLPAGGRRQHPRHTTCLEVGVEGEGGASRDCAIDVSEGGLFVRTSRLAPLGTRLRLKLRLPAGPPAETAAKVVRVVGEADARARGVTAGIGLAFLDASPEFRRRLAAFLESLPVRPPRVLVADEDALFRSRLARVLDGLGVQVEVAGSAAQAIDRLVARLFEVDLVLCDLQMSGLEVSRLLERIRERASVCGLKLVGLERGQVDGVPRPPADPRCVLSKRMPFEAMVESIRAMLRC